MLASRPTNACKIDSEHTTTAIRDVRANSNGDFDRFDLIVAMDRNNLTDLQALIRQPADSAKLRLFSDFLPNRAPKDVPDPYYGGTKGFDTVITMLEDGCGGILHALCKNPEIE